MRTIAGLAAPATGTNNSSSPQRTVVLDLEARSKIQPRAGRQITVAAGMRRLATKAGQRVRIKTTAGKALFVSKERVPVPGNGEPAMSEDPLPNTAHHGPHYEDEAELRAFEALLETDANDDVGRVVDMYFRRPASAADEPLGTTRMI